MLLVIIIILAVARLVAIATAYGLWGVSWMSGIRLDSVWGVLLPCALIPLMAMMDLSFSQWRVLMVIALLATVSMLYHKRLRHYLLLPSCIALAGGVMAISLKLAV